MSTIKVDGIRSNSASSDAITLASDGTCTANITNNLSNRNKVINGAMAVHQRSSSVTGISNANGYNTADRWSLAMSSGGGTWTNTISTDTPDGFANSYKLDCTTANGSLAAGDNLIFRQILEGQDLQDFAKGTSAAKGFTVSFYLKTNKTGTVTAGADLFDIVKGQLLDEGLTEEEIRDIMLTLTPDEIMSEMAVNPNIAAMDAKNKADMIARAQANKVPDKVREASKRQMKAGTPREDKNNPYTTQDKKTIIDYNKNK